MKKNRFFEILFKHRKVPLKKMKNQIWHSGYRNDLGISVRSGWEANMCRYFNFIGEPYLFEHRMFPLSNGKYYLPDFYLPEKNTYVELKGREFKEGIDKFKLFQDEYSKFFNIQFVDSKEYMKLEKQYKRYIPEWE